MAEASGAGQIHSDPPSSHTDAFWKPLVRVGLATSLVLVVFVFMLLSYAVPEFQLCRPEFPPAATSGTVRVCGPLTSDPILAGFLGLLVVIPVGYIMRPFISKFGFAGISVETTAMRTQIQETKTTANLALVKAASATTEPTHEVAFHEGPASGHDRTSLVSPEREAAATQFGQAWGRVSAYLEEIHETRQFGDARLSKILAWSERNSFDIAVLRATHDLLSTTPGSLSTQDLIESARRGLWLLARLEGHLGHELG
jgi:hypothetical protein